MICERAHRNIVRMSRFSFFPTLITTGGTFQCCIGARVDFGSDGSRQSRRTLGAGLVDLL